MQHKRSRQAARLLVAGLTAGALVLAGPAGPAAAHPGHDHGSDSGGDAGSSGSGSGGSAKSGGAKSGANSAGGAGNGSKSVCADGTTRTATTPCDATAR